MASQRLDAALVSRGLVATRSQAGNYVKLGYVEVNGEIAAKAGQPIKPGDQIKINLHEQYVSRAALKLAPAAAKFKLNFRGKLVLDAGSSTGGFTEYALKRGARKVIAVDVGSQQMHPKISADSRVELHERTDVRDFEPAETPDLILADLSFISLRLVLPHLREIAGPQTLLTVLFKPQFEAQRDQLNRGIVKNDKLRRDLMKAFEQWVQKLFVIAGKVDSEIEGSHGNTERFYLLKAKH